MTGKARILFLDLGTKTGWAYKLGDGIESGVQDFSLKRGESKGMLYHYFRRWLENMVLKMPKTPDGMTRIIKDGKFCEPIPCFDIICYEQTHNRGGAATETAAGLATRVQEFCAVNGPNHAVVHSTTLKKFWTGAGNAGKPDMIAKCEDLGFCPLDDNEADAIAGLHWALDNL